MMKWLSFISQICLLLLITAETPLFAQSRMSNWPQTQQVITHTFNQENGLPVVSTTDIVLGADNHLYIGSSAGVSRFNGTEFNTISTEQFPQLKSNRFLHLFASPDSAIWMLDEQGFFSRWKNGKVNAFHSLFADKTLPGWLLKVSNSGDAWISNGTDFMSFDRQKKKFVPRLRNLDFEYYEFIALSDSVLLILTKEGLFEYSDNFLTLRVPGKELPFTPESQHTFYWETNLYQLNHHQVAIADSGAVAVYDFKNHSYSLFHYPDAITGTPQNVIKVDENTLLLQALEGHFNLDLNTKSFIMFAGTAGDELWRTNYDPFWKGKRLYISESRVNFDGNTIFKTANEERIVQAIQDKEDNLWLTVAGRGLVQIILPPFHVFSTENVLQSDNTYSVIEDESNNIWLASFEFGIHRIGKHDIDYWSREQKTLINNLVWALYQRKNEDLLASLWDNGIYNFNGKQWIPFLLNGTDKLLQTESFFEDDAGSFWIGSRLALYKKDAQSELFNQVFTSQGNPILRTQVIQQDTKQRVWLGTHGLGLLVYEDKKIRPIHFEGLDTQPKIRDLYFSGTDTLWVASETNGLIKVILDNFGNIASYQIISKREGLPDIGVHRIIPDPYGFFWLSSNQGISRINKASLNSYLEGETPELWIEVFTEADGLPIREANGGTQSNGLIASDSTIFIPTQKGVILFNPASFLNRNPFEHTSINLSSVKTENNEYQIFGRREFDLKRGERSLTLDFELVHFTNPGKVDIEYQISTLRGSWSLLSKDKQLSITNLPPGIHQIELKIAGLPRAFNPGNSFSLNIPYYFYEKTWFYLLLAGFFSVGIIALFYGAAKAAKKREQELNLRVEERTQLLNEQKNETDKAFKTIQKQARELKHLNEVKTNFFINMTHELRTPLSLIKGPLHLLQDTSRRNDIDQQEQLALIEKNSIHLNDVVDQLLDLLRLEGEVSSAQYKKIELVNFVRTQASQFLSSDGLITKDLKLPESEKEYFILADPEACSLIINNLITNAIKYTQKHDLIELKIYAEHEYNVLEVSDTGIGISEQEIQFIFDPFYRAQNALDQKGSGIGLSIVKSFMDRLGGKVTLQSNLGEGTNIRIYFPLPGLAELNNAEPYNNSHLLSHKRVAQISRELIDDKFTKINQSTELNDTGSGVTILLVEDNKDLQLFMTRLLENKYKLHVVNNGVEALDFLKKHTPKLVITDLMMPEMDGIQFIKQMRLNASSSAIPVVVLSAKKTERSITEGLSSGAQVYLTKPIDNTILLAQIDSLLEREERLNSNTGPVPFNFEAPKNEFQIKINELILRHISDPNLSVQNIADTLHISRPTLYRKWKEVSDVSLSEYIIKTRLSETIKLIKERGHTFAEASVVCGFSEPSYFSRVFKKYYGKTPTDYFKAGNKG